jgi:hypothetical protein
VPGRAHAPAGTPDPGGTPGPTAAGGG